MFKVCNILISKGVLCLNLAACVVFYFLFVVQMSLITRETRECPLGFPAWADLRKLTIALSPQDDKDSQRRETFSTNLHWSVPSHPFCRSQDASLLLDFVLELCLLYCFSFVLLFVYPLPYLSVILFPPPPFYDCFACFLCYFWYTPVLVMIFQFEDYCVLCYGVVLGFCLMGRDVMWTFTRTPTYVKDLLSSFSGQRL